MFLSKLLKPCKAFINGSYKNMKNGVLSGKQMFFSICSGEVKQKGKRYLVILFLETSFLRGVNPQPMNQKKLYL